MRRLITVLVLGVAVLGIAGASAAPTLGQPDPGAGRAVAADSGPPVLVIKDEGLMFENLAPLITVNSGQPGTSTQGTLVVQNQGSGSYSYYASATRASGDGPLFNALELKILGINDGGDSQRTVYEGNLSELNNQLMGSLAPNSQETLRFQVRLPAGAGNAYQDKSTAFAFNFSALVPGSTPPPGPIESPPGPVEPPGPPSPPTPPPLGPVSPGPSPTPPPGYVPGEGGGEPLLPPGGPGGPTGGFNEGITPSPVEGPSPGAAPPPAAGPPVPPTVEGPPGAGGLLATIASHWPLVAGGAVLLSLGVGLGIRAWQRRVSRKIPV